MKARYSWVKAVATLSDTAGQVERWTAPAFNQTAQPESRLSSEDVEALARAQGFQLGKTEGLAEGRAQADELIRMLHQLVEQMASPFRAQQEVITRELAQLAVTLARQIVRRELQLDSSMVSASVDEALATLYELEGEVVLFINPHDAALVRELEPQVLAETPWRVVEDSSIGVGGCQVKTANSFVDASVERQMESVFGQLLAQAEVVAQS
jgi:flagellar assembly protein FliH